VEKQSADRYVLWDRDGKPLGTAPANAAQQQRVYDLARALRLLSAPKLTALTGNNVGFFNNYTLLETVRRKYLEGNGEGLFAKRGRVMQIPFFVNDDEKMFAEAFFFNFSPKGVQLGDFHPEGKTVFRSLDEVEASVKYLRAFWELVYEVSDEVGPLMVGSVWDSLLLKLDSSVILQILTPEYVGEVINRALRSLAAELDAVLPPGVLRSPREWWEVIRAKFDGLVFSQENEMLFKRFERKDFRATAGVAKSAVVTPPKPLAPVSAAEGTEICFAGIRHHFQTPVGAPACSKAGCPRIHADGYKKLSAEAVIVQLEALGRGDFKDTVKCIREVKGTFRD
jgi:hypothetical protein